MKRFLVISGLILGSSLFPVAAIAATFSQLVVYGDSLSDLGRASLATGGAVPPYTEGNGRFSNGKIWIEYLAEKLSITTDPSTNFAIGGATTGTLNTIPIPVPQFVGLEQQINNDLTMHNPDALYVVWAGANDYLGGGITNPAITIGNLSIAINTLIGRGAKNILVPNLANLGELPSTNDDPTISAGLNFLTQAHNTGLAASISNLSVLFPSVKLSLLDVNSLFNDVVTDPASARFSNVTDGCLLVACTNPNEYLFWDTIHPTTAGHKLIGDLAFDTLNASSTAVPEPTSMLGSLVALGFVVSFKRKLKPSKLTDRELVETQS
jgi:thermolabile hemolysin